MIARKTWREIRAMVLVFTIVLEALLVPAVLLWPALKESGTLAGIGKMMPMQVLSDMMAQMNVRNADAAFRAYMAVMMFFRGVNIVGLACTVLLATGMIARERENQTLEFLLARPVARSRVLWSKAWVIALSLVVPIFLTSWTAIPLAHHIGLSLPFAELTLAAAYASTFVLAFFALTCAVSVVSRTQVHVAFVVGVLIMVEVCVYFTPSIRFASVFCLSDFTVYSPILAGNLGWQQLLLTRGVWLLLAAAGLYLLADRLFRKLDL